MSTIQEKVLAGEAFLNEHIPGWKAQINPQELRMQNGYYCILGQLADNVEECRVDDYSEMKDYLGLRDQDCVDLGFCVETATDESGDTYTVVDEEVFYSELTKAWKERLA